MKNFLRVSAKDLFLVTIILLIALFVWYPLTNFALTGLGFVYLTKSFQVEHFVFPVSLADFYWFALLTGIVFSKVFTTHMSLYYWTELIFLLATFVLYYYLILSIFNKRLIAFVAAITFSVNYFGYGDIIGSGLYPWFQERIPLMLFLIPSFLFLHKHLISNKNKFLIYSLVLFFLGIGISHWGILFLAPYIFYPICWSLFKNKKLEFKKSILTSSSYLLIAAFFVVIQNSTWPGAGPTWGFMEYLLNPFQHQYPEKIFRQLVYWSSYLPIFEIFKNGYPLYPASPLYYFINPEPSMRYAKYIAVIYPLAALIIYKKLPQFRALLFTLILSTLAMFYLNSYWGRYEIFNQAGANRYLYLPTYLLIIFWALFFVAFLQNKKKRKGNKFYVFKILICFLFIMIYLLLNFWLINDSLKWKNESYKKVNLYWDYVVKQARNWEKNTLVILPFKYIDPQGTAFLNDYINKVYFITSEEDWKKIATSSATSKVIRIEFDEFCRCAKEIEVDKKTLK